MALKFAKLTRSAAGVLPVKYDELTPGERAAVRAEYVRKQKGYCYYCKAPLHDEPISRVKRRAINWTLFPLGFLKYPIHLHHDHKTGLTLGAVHAKCNAYLWEVHRE